MSRAVRFASASLLLVLFVGAAPLSAQNGNGLKTLSLDMYMDWERVSNPQISPDGQHVVYTRGWIDQMNDRWESTLYIMNADGTSASAS